MKIRIKFAKRGSLKFVGHLDIMRYFQKLIRRANIDIAYSEGFNPHQKMSFAQPLGVGMLSEGEYVDIEVNSTYSTDEALERLNSANVPGIEILSYRQLDDNSGNAMATVAAADYLIRFRGGHEIKNFDLSKEFQSFIDNCDEIIVLKETKKSQIELDIKPFIHKVNTTAYGENTIFVQLSTGSVTNIKPELIANGFCNFAGIEMDQLLFEYTRLELYGKDDNNHLIPLMDFGKDIK